MYYDDRVYCIFTEVIRVSLFEFVLMIVFGSFFAFTGWRIWKKEQINLIHDYHYTKVKEEDKKPYTKKMGKATIIMGIGMYLTGAIDFVTKNTYGWIAFGISLFDG